MTNPSDAKRRDLLRLMSVGGVVFMSSLLRGVSGCSSDSSKNSNPNAGAARGATEDFFFLQISDTHWGFSGAMVNPESTTELPNAVATINRSAMQPDFIVFTGDLTHNTDDPSVRRQRMQEFQQITADLRAPVHFMPGEHDAAADAGAAYRETLGPLQYSFDHKGIHFIALDNVSDATANLGQAQLEWLRQDLASRDVEAPIVVFAHRPLWNLKAEWDWNTPDGQMAIDLLLPFNNVTVFFGHIHQELHHETGHISHHSARSLMFALPTPETPGMRAPIPWDPDHPNAGLGYRNIEATTTTQDYQLTELLVADA